MLFSAKKVESLGVLYYVTNTTTKKIDSLLISQTGSNVEKCFCNDTLASFYVNNYPSPEIEKFQMENGKWKYLNTITLPPIFPMIGMLEEDKNYERYSHQLVSINKVISELTILKAKDQKLTPIESYSIEYRIKPEKLGLELEKKTRKNN